MSLCSIDQYHSFSTWIDGYEVYWLGVIAYFRDDYNSSDGYFKAIEGSVITGYQFDSTTNVVYYNQVDRVHIWLRLGFHD